MSKHKHSFWISYTDLMTLLMIVFLMLTVSYMQILRKKEEENRKIVDDYYQSKVNIYNTLKETFKDDLSQWEAVIDADLTIKFTNPEVLFDSKQSTIKNKFKEILDEFIPKYITIIRKFQKEISEVRIEGHTDSNPIRDKENSYIDNMALSQDRSRQVLNYIRNHDAYKELTPIEMQNFQYLFTANGMSFGRQLNDNQLPVLTNGGIPNDVFSRRVEFRIVTKSSEILDSLKKNSRQD